MSRISDSYHKHFEKNRLWEQLTWLGVPMWKLPNDAIVLQEIIFETKPKIVVETGTGLGGSALYYASILTLIDSGKVITVDLSETNFPNIPLARKVTQFIGRSDDVCIIKIIKKLTENQSTMVVLDSFHSEEYVLKELELYAPFVTKGNYLVVEDTHVGGNPVDWKWGKGPMEAVKRFIEKSDEFVIDRDREKLIMTFNPMGYIKRIK